MEEEVEEEVEEEEEDGADEKVDAERWPSGARKWFRCGR